MTGSVNENIVKQLKPSGSTFAHLEALLMRASFSKVSRVDWAKETTLVEATMGGRSVKKRIIEEANCFVQNKKRF